MNGKLPRAKKNIRPRSKRSATDKHANNFNSKLVGAEFHRGEVICPPKEKPEIPKYYIQTVKKKSSHHKLNTYTYFNRQTQCENHHQLNDRIIISIQTSKADPSRRQFIKTTNSDLSRRQLKNKINNNDYQLRTEKQQICTLQHYRGEQIVNTQGDLTCKQIIMNKLRHFNQEKRSFFEIHKPEILLSEVPGEKHEFSELKTNNSCNNVRIKSRKTFHEQMSEFEEQIPGIESVGELETFKYLENKQNIDYKTKHYCHYLEKNQSRIGWFRRAVIINWMMEVCEGLGSSRETLATGVCLLDSYLSRSAAIALEELQLVACGALSLSNKIDGAKFNLHMLSSQTQSISVDQIFAMEQKISVKLCWKLNPPTLNMWANRIALQWDMYLQSQISLPPSFTDKLSQIQFKTKSGQNYYNLRTLLQYIDFAMMQAHSMRYDSHLIAASFIYIILTVKLKIHKMEQVIEKFPNSSKYLLEETELNGFYCEFLNYTFGLSLNELLPDIQYCSTFCILPLTYDLPLIVHCDQQQTMTLQEFYSYQTHNPNYLACLRRRDKSKD